VSADTPLSPPVGAEDHVAGTAAAEVTLVEYGDYECSHCGTAHPLVKRLQQQLGSRLRFVFRNFPLSKLHPHAVHAAEMAEAAALQGRFWELHDMLFEHQDALTDDDLMSYAVKLRLDAAQLKEDLEAGPVTERVRADLLGGVRSGVKGTPTFFIDGYRFDGNWRDESSLLAALVDKEQR
jgi:protein-disulfide isomerase